MKWIMEVPYKSFLTILADTRKRFDAFETSVHEVLEYGTDEGIINGLIN